MRTGWTVATVLTLLLLGLAGTAAAAPVTIDFESGATVGDKITGQYGAPGGFPAGPVFRTPSTVGFDAGCPPPTLMQATTFYPAFSGGNLIKLDGCATAEFYPTAAFLSLGYTAKTVEFELAETGTSFSSDSIVITAFRADKTIASQELTSLPAQATPVYKPMIVSSAAYDIAFVVIERGLPFIGTSMTHVDTGVANTLLLLDDLTYDPPAAPPDSSFVIATTPSSLRLAAGTATDVTVPITWVNNPSPSGSPVALEVTAPPGVTATVTSPNPTTSGTATVHLVAAKDAPLGNVSVRIDGFVDKGTPAQKSATTTLPVQIAAPFGLNQPPDLTVASCSPTTTTLRVFTEPGFTDPVEVGVFAPSGVRITSIGGLEPSSPSDAAYITRPATNGELLIPVTFVADRSRKPTANAQYELVVRSAGFSTQSLFGKLDVRSGAVTSVLNAGTLAPLTSVRAPMMRQPGTKVELRGTGFCQGSTVRFGANGSSGTPSTIAPDGRSLVVDVPRGAVSGPVILERPADPQGGAPAQLLDPFPNLNVTDFRSIYGFQFVNRGQKGDFTIQQFENTFGAAAMYVQVDVCAAATLGILHCPFPSGIPDPVAQITMYALAGKGKGGLCYGIARSVGDLATGGSLSPFTPLGARSANGLDGPAAPGDALLTRIGERHLTQFGEDVINAQVADFLTGPTPADHAAAIRFRALAELTNGTPPLGGRPPIVSIYDAGAGHALTVYDVDDLGGGAYALIVADPNIPFSPDEAKDVTAHRSGIMTSRITVDPAAGTWTYPGLTKKTDDGQTLAWSRVISPKTIEILPGKLTYDPKPRLPGLLTWAKAIVLASDGSHLGQVSDEGGRTLIGSDGLGRSGAGAIPKAALIGPTDVGDAQNPIAVLPSRGAYDIAAQRSGRGPGTITMIGHGLSASASAGGGGSGGAAAGTVSDALHVDGAAREARLSPGAAGAATLTLGSGGHVAALETHGHKGASDALRLLPGGGITAAHTGVATPATLVLTAAGATGVPVTARVPLGTLHPGERVAIALPDWRRLSGTRVTLVRTRGGSTIRRRVRAGGSTARLRAPAVRVRAAGGRLKVTTTLRRAGRAPWIAASATVAVLRGRKVVAHTRLTATSVAVRTGRAALTWRSKRLAKGAYRVLVLASGSGVARAVTSSDTRLVQRRVSLR